MSRDNTAAYTGTRTQGSGRHPFCGLTAAYTGIRTLGSGRQEVSGGLEAMEGLWFAEDLEGLEQWWADHGP